MNYKYILIAAALITLPLTVISDNRNNYRADTDVGRGSPKGSSGKPSSNGLEIKGIVTKASYEDGSKIQINGISYLIDPMQTRVLGLFRPLENGFEIHEGQTLSFKYDFTENGNLLTLIKAQQ